MFTRQLRPQLVRRPDLEGLAPLPSTGSAAPSTLKVRSATSSTCPDRGSEGQQSTAVSLGRPRPETSDARRRSASAMMSSPSKLAVTRLTVCPWRGKRRDRRSRTATVGSPPVSLPSWKPLAVARSTSQETCWAAVTCALMTPRPPSAGRTRPGSHPHGGIPGALGSLRGLATCAKRPDTAGWAPGSGSRLPARPSTS